MKIICPQINTDRHRFFLTKLSVFICVHLWIISLFTTVYAQNLHQWGNISLFHGLPSEKVHAVTQTKDGLFWFGTENGLAKFDGRRVQTIQLDNVTQIFSLTVGRDGTLFVGTNNGAFRLNEDKFLPISETQGKQINAISASQRTFFGTQNGELLELNYDSAKMLFQLDIPVTSVAAKDEQIYFGTEGRGLFEFKDDEVKEIKVSFRPYFINDLDFSNDGSVWLGSRAKLAESGLFGFFPSANFDRFGESSGTVNALKFDAKNELWLGTKDNGVYRFRGGNEVAHYTFENTSGGLRSNQIFTVFVDREGVIWFGTDKGVCRFDDASPINYLFSEDSDSNYIRALHQAKDGKVYAGTNKGLYVFDGANWLESEDYANKTVYAISETLENQIIIGTPSDNIRAVQSLNGKNYTVVFGKGLFENDKLIFTHNEIISMLVEGGKIYLGTVKDGVLEFADGQVKTLNILPNNAIRAIEGSAEKGLWLAGEKGLYLWQHNEIQPVIENIKFQSLHTNNEKVFAGSHNKGLFQAKFDNEFGWVFSNLNVEQGLLSSGIFALLLVENSLLIGTGKGVSKYSPNNFAAEIVPNRVISERVHSTKEISEGIKLEYPQNTLTVEITGLSSRTFPENFQYGFLLKNSKGEEVLRKLTKDSQISFENLKPDNYSVEIYAFNQDLLKSEPFKFNFSVAKAPFPWTSTALAILLVIAVAALIMAIIERRQISTKNKELAAARFDLANEAERERRRIARDLHDQTLADLRKLMLKSDKLEGETTEFRSEIESVSDEIRRICEDLSPSVLENVGLTAALEFLLSNTIENYKFFSSEGLEERLSFPSNVQMQIYRIAQEVLNNIKRHAEANFVEMKISDGDVFKLIIENDGKSFLADFENLPKGRGISNIKSRAELIEAKISWENSEDGKTIFILEKVL